MSMPSRNAITRYGSLLLLGLTLGACGGGDEGAEPAGGAAEPAGGAPAQPAGGAGAAGGAAAAAGDEVAMGQQIFGGQGICYTCHGQNGVGSALAPNLTDDEWLNVTPGADLEAQIINVIRTGVPQPKEHPAPMPPMGGVQLSDEQIQAVAAYVLSL